MRVEKDFLSLHFICKLHYFFRREYFSYQFKCEWNEQLILSLQHSSAGLLSLHSHIHLSSFSLSQGEGLKTLHIFHLFERKKREEYFEGTFWVVE